MNAIPQEWISERIVDIPVAPAEEQTVVQGTFEREHVEEITQIIDVPVLHIPEEPIEVLPQESISDCIGNQIAVDVPVPQMSVDEVGTETTLPREQVRQRNDAELPVEDVQCSDDPMLKSPSANFRAGY